MAIEPERFRDPQRYRRPAADGARNGQPSAEAPAPAESSADAQETRPAPSAATPTPPATGGTPAPVVSRAPTPPPASASTGHVQESAYVERSAPAASPLVMHEMPPCGLISNLGARGIPMPPRGWRVPPMLAQPLEGAWGTDAQAIEAFAQKRYGRDLGEAIANAASPEERDLILAQAARVLELSARPQPSRELRNAARAITCADGNKITRAFDGLDADGRLLARFLLAAKRSPQKALSLSLSKQRLFSRGQEITDLGRLTDPTLRPGYANVPRAFTVYVKDAPLGISEVPEPPLRLQDMLTPRDEFGGKTEIDFLRSRYVEIDLGGPAVELKEVRARIEVIRERLAQLGGAEKLSESFHPRVQTAESLTLCSEWSQLEARLESLRNEVPDLAEKEAQLAPIDARMQELNTEFLALCEEYKEICTPDDLADCSDLSLTYWGKVLVETGVLESNLEMVPMEDLASTLKVWAAILRYDSPIEDMRYVQEMLNPGDLDLSWARKMEPTPENIEALKSFVHQLALRRPEYADLRIEDVFVGGTQELRSLQQAMSDTATSVEQDGYSDPALLKAQFEFFQQRPNSGAQLAALKDIVELAAATHEARAVGAKLEPFPTGVVIAGNRGTGKTSSGWSLGMAMIAAGVRRGVVDPEHPELGEQPMMVKASQCVPKKVTRERPDGTTYEAYEAEFDLYTHLREGYCVIIDECSAEKDNEDFHNVLRDAEGNDGEFGAIKFCYREDAALFNREGGVARRKGRVIEIDDFNVEMCFDTLKYQLAKTNRENLERNIPPINATDEDLFVFASLISLKKTREDWGNGSTVVSDLQKAINRFWGLQGEVRSRPGATGQERLSQLSLDLMTGGMPPTGSEAIREAEAAFDQNPDMTEYEREKLKSHYAVLYSQHRKLFAGLSEVEAQMLREGSMTVPALVRHRRLFQRGSALRINVSPRSDVGQLVDQLHHAAVASRSVAAETVDPTRVGYIDFEVLDQWQGRTEEKMLEIAKKSTVLVLDMRTLAPRDTDPTSKQKSESINQGLALLGKRLKDGTLTCNPVILGQPQQVTAFLASQPLLAEMVDLGETINATGIDEYKRAESEIRERLMDGLLPFTFEESSWRSALRLFPGIKTAQDYIVEAAVRMFEANGGHLAQRDIDILFQRLAGRSDEKTTAAGGDYGNPESLTFDDVKEVIAKMKLSNGRMVGYLERGVVNGTLQLKDWLETPESFMNSDELKKTRLLELNRWHTSICRSIADLADERRKQKHSEDGDWRYVSANDIKYIGKGAMNAIRELKGDHIDLTSFTGAGLAALLDEVKEDVERKAHHIEHTKVGYPALTHEHILWNSEDVDRKSKAKKGGGGAGA